MGTKEKLREIFLKMPSDFTFDEMQRLLEGYGYERSNKGKTSGSRLIFKNEENGMIYMEIKENRENRVGLFSRL